MPSSGSTTMRMLSIPICLALAAASWCHAEDWPQFRGSELFGHFADVGSSPHEVL